MTKIAGEYFEFKEEREIDGVLKQFFTCNICKKEINATNNYGKTSHLQNLHKDVYAKLQTPVESIEQKRLKLILDCVEIVAVNGRSFSHLLDSGLQSMINEKLCELESAGRQFNLNDEKHCEVKDCIRRMSENARQKIADEIKDIPISLMCDIATKHGRSLFGFSIQYVANGKHRIRSIGMIHLDKSHTGKYLASLIAKRLKEYGVVKDQLLTITTDNGTNMIKMIKEMRKMEYTVDRLENTANMMDTA